MGDLSQFIPPYTNLLILPGVIAGFIVHELAHSIVAYLLGDLSQVERGRMTLNPLRHISWFGTLTFVLFGFGWARPLQMDWKYFRRRYVGTFLVAIAGAVANLALAVCILVLTLVLVTLVALLSGDSPPEILGLLMNVEPGSPRITAWTAAFTTYVIYANLALAFFNLLPFPTLDGFTALASLLGLLRSPDAQPAEVAARPKPTRGDLRPSPNTAAQRQPADIHFELGAEYHAAGEYADAIARYRQALSSDPSYGPAYVNLGLAYLAVDQRPRAIQSFRAATQHAADEKSRSEAWAQLQKLSEAPPLPPRDQTDSAGRQAPPEAGPWTDIRPAPNWVALGVGSAVTLITSACVYIYLIIGLVRYLST